MDNRAKVFFENKIAELEKEISEDLTMFYKRKAVLKQAEMNLEAIAKVLGSLDDGADVIEALKITKTFPSALKTLEESIINNTRYRNRLKEELSDL